MNSYIQGSSRVKKEGEGGRGGGPNMARGGNGGKGFQKMN